MQSAASCSYICTDLARIISTTRCAREFEGQIAHISGYWRVLKQGPRCSFLYLLPLSSHITSLALCFRDHCHLSLYPQTSTQPYNSMADSKVNLVAHPIIKAELSKLRQASTSPKEFREVRYRNHGMQEGRCQVSDSPTAHRASTPSVCCWDTKQRGLLKSRLSRVYVYTKVPECF